MVNFAKAHLITNIFQRQMRKTTILLKVFHMWNERTLLIENFHIDHLNRRAKCYLERKMELLQHDVTGEDFSLRNDYEI
jgi:hypothetical protein